MTRTIGFWSGLMAALLCAGSAFAEPSAADRATARALAGEGYQALQTKDYGTAADRFSRADSLVHAPTLMIDWARSLVGLGKFVEAQERYEQILREGVDAKSPKSWQKALTDAGVELAALKPRLAWVTISVSGSNEARVTIDGAPVPPAAIGVRRAINPGERSLRVVAKGYLAQKKTLELAEGSESQADFTLEPDPDQQAAASSMLDATAPAAPSSAPARSPIPMYAAFGVGGAGLVLGGVTGALALGKHSSLSKACNSAGQCPSSQSDMVKSYHTLGTISAVGFAVGLVGVGAGTALWVLGRSSEAAPAAQGLMVHPYVGLASLGAVGSF
ncbi:MAG TPA: hypothetical protein VNW92_22565 [Polyangiaceae bacterium]|nr:hypothetical protein [Polyangiaceae bacterium]